MLDDLGHPSPAEGLCYCEMLEAPRVCVWIKVTLHLVSLQWSAMVSCFCLMCSSSRFQDRIHSQPQATNVGIGMDIACNHVRLQMNYLLSCMSP